MSTIATEVKDNQVTSTEALRVRPEEVPLPQVLRTITQDAAKDPALYLNETAVPRGGE